MLAGLPSLEVADLSFNIYMEAALSLAPLLEENGLPKLRRLDLRHGPLPRLAAPEGPAPARGACAHRRAEASCESVCCYKGGLSDA